MDLLDEYQKRGLTVTLRVVEEIIHDIERTLTEGERHGIFKDMRDDIQADNKAEILSKLPVIRERITDVKDAFGLEKIYRENTNEVLGRLNFCWEILIGSKAKGLAGYGSVSKGLDEVLDPQMDAIIKLIEEITKVLKSH